MSFLLVKVGKSPLNDVCIEDGRVGDFHLELFRDMEGNVYLTDLNSEHGTYVDDKKIEDAILLSGEEIVKIANAFALNWRAIIQKADENSFTIGADKKNKIQIAEADSFHLQIFKDFKGNIFANDLKSTHGTFINGHKIQEVALLKSGDRLKIGNNQYDWEKLFINQTFPVVAKPKPKEKIVFEQVRTTQPEMNKAPDIEVNIKNENKISSPNKKKSRWLFIAIILLIDLFLLIWLRTII